MTGAPHDDIRPRTPARAVARPPGMKGSRMLVLLLAVVLPAAAACPPPGVGLEALRAFKGEGWAQPAADDARQALALALLDCLSDPRPELRDELAFAALQAWMRAGRLSDATLATLRTRLLDLLARPADPAGFTQPFAVLVLAEVARVDRLRGHLSDDERAALVARGTQWLAGWRDARAFDEVEGWRHGVAHGADLMLQLALNPRLTRPQADALLAAVASQVLPGTGVAWRHGEPDRLAAPVFYLARGSLLDTTAWERWFTELAARRPHTPLNATTLAHRHDLSAFLNALYVAVQEAGNDEQKARLLPGLRKALREAG